MSTKNDDLAVAAAVSPEKCCASCGVAAIDDIKLEPCPHCDLVKYCSDACQLEHREKHEAACKKRAAELYEEILFKQPEGTHLDDCPICCLPMPLATNRYRIHACCLQYICLGCLYAHKCARRCKEIRCPFCRHLSKGKKIEETEKLYMDRAKLNDPIALRRLAKFNYDRENHESAFKYWSTAAELGDAESMFNLSVMYCNGEGVEEDKDKHMALLEKAAIAGHPDARYYLGVYEANFGRFDRAVAHWLIAAALGYNDATKAMKNRYKAGHVSKDDFAAALRAYQAAVDAVKSPQRQAAEKFYNISD